MNRIIILLSFSICPYVYCSGEYKEKWHDKIGMHEVSIVINESQQDDLKNAKISAQEILGDKVLWHLNDFVNDCPLDVTLSVFPHSFETKNFFNDGYRTIFFSYKVGCIGGIDPVTVKYFAYHKGVKYALRGEETLITEDGTYGGEQRAIPDGNLKSTPLLLEYMLKKWPAVSTTDLKQSN
jgi:hypothetical protein